MTRQRRIDEELWEEGDEELSADHVVERFFSQHERTGHETGRKAQSAARGRRRAPAPPEADE